MDVQLLAVCHQLFEFLHRVAVQAHHIALAHDGLADHIGVLREQVANGRAHQIGTVGIKPFLDEEVDLGQVHQADIDRDLVAVRKFLLR
jgi:hypothetical protein